MKKLTVIMPCYNQLDLAKRSLSYLEKQTLKDFDIIIIDDQSTENYQSLPQEFPNLKVKYIRNDMNLGAMENMFKSINFTVDTPYKMCLHEDDVVHPQYFEKALEIMDAEKEVAFIGSEGIWFKKTEEINVKEFKGIGYKIFDQRKLAEYFLKINRLIFGSIIYRSATVSGQQFDMENYNVLTDRPFLLEVARVGKAIVIKEPMIYVRDHGETDKRGQNIQSKHLFNLYKNYKQMLVSDDWPENEFLKFSTNDLLLSFPAQSNLSFGQYIKEGQKLGLIKLKYLNLKGWFSIITLLIGKKNSDRILGLIK